MHLSNFNDMGAGDRLATEIERLGAPVVVGLDPRLDAIPQHIVRSAAKSVAAAGMAATGGNSSIVAHDGASCAVAAQAIYDWGRELIDALAGVVPAVKPQIAFYEQYGWEGVKAYQETVHYAQTAGMVAIGDVKRCDIGSTAEAYAAGHLGGVFGTDWVTVNGYLGTDGIRPFIEEAEAHGRGLFVLVRTSNPSAGELQDLRLAPCDEFAGPETVYQRMARLVGDWGRGENLGRCTSSACTSSACTSSACTSSACADGASVGDARHRWSSVGAVVGATYPREAAQLREMLPNTIFLVPGYGAQGAGAEDVLPAFDAAGRGAIVNSSRGITFAYMNKETGCPPERHAQAAVTAARVMIDDIRRALGQ